MTEAPPLHTTAALIEAASSLWRRATHHPFLDDVREGTLGRAAFARWLVQDYQFVRQLLAAQGMMLARAPRSDHEVLVGGLGAIEQELSWFESHAKTLKLDLHQEMLPTCRAYTDFLLALDRQPYVVQIVSLWALERAYLDGWTTAKPCASPYEEFVEHWTTPDFAGYVAALETAADAALETATPEMHQAAYESFRWVARYEEDFWQMAYAEPTDSS